MPPMLLEALRSAGAFRLFTPREQAGLELPLRAALETFEAIGALDVAVAWNVWNGNMGFSAAMLPESGVRAIWREGARDPVIANAVRPNGVATSVAGGFSLTGRWDLVSAIHAADFVALFALVDPAAERAPDVRVFYVPRARLQVLDTWHVHALRGTGSDTVVAEAVHVPDDQVVSPFAPARIDRPLYRIPAFTLASSGVGAIVVGAAQAAIDAVIELSRSKTSDGALLADRARTQGEIGRAQASVRAARALILESAAAIDAAAEAKMLVGESLRADLRAAMSHAALTARAVLTSMYSLASSSALYDGQPIERLFRDGSAAIQHAVLQESHFETYGRVLLGRPAGVPVL
jgi:alkylation response protein AidB-like acyl-CoA dehydrogenase